MDSLSVAARLPDGRVLIVGSFDRLRLLDEALSRGDPNPSMVGVPPRLPRHAPIYPTSIGMVDPLDAA
jgi:hypothetical protein